MTANRKSQTPQADHWDTGVIHGRFQVFHNDHLTYLLAGKARCDHLVVGITNPDPRLTRDEAADPERSNPMANPLTYYERYLTIRSALVEARILEKNFSIVPFPINLPDLYRFYVPLDAVFFLTIYDDWGLRKHEYFKSLNLTTCVLWETTPDKKGLSATDIRQAMAEGKNWAHLMPKSVTSLMREWNVPARLKRLYAESSRGK